MILYLGDNELYEFIYEIEPDISTDILLKETQKLIVSEYSHNAASLIRSAAALGIPILGILDGYLSVAEAFGGECLPIENCPEGKQELAVLDTSSPIYRSFGHVSRICRGNACAIDEASMPDELDCIARSENGDIIAFCNKTDGNSPNIFAVNYYLNSALTEKGDVIILNFLNIR